jgi:hypothetical protein
MVNAKVPNIYAGARTGEYFPRFSSAFKSFICHFEKLPLHRVHAQHLRRSHPKETMVEQSWVFRKQISSRGIDATRTAMVTVIKSIQVNPLASELLVSCFSGTE